MRTKRSQILLALLLAAATNCTGYEAPYPNAAKVNSQRITVGYATRINAFDASKIQLRLGCFTCTSLQFSASKATADAAGYFQQIYIDLPTALAAGKYYLTFGEGSATGSEYSKNTNAFGSSGSDKTVFAAEPGIFIFDYP